MTNFAAQLWGTVIQRRDYPDFIGITVEIVEHNDIPFTNAGDTAIVAVSRAEEYLPVVGERVCITTRNGPNEKPKVTAAPLESI